MNDITKLSPKQLRQAADLKEKIDALQKQYEQLLGALAEAHAPKGETLTETPTKRFSAATIARMRKAQKERWAKKKGTAQPGEAAQKRKPKRKLTAAGRAALSASAKARWRKAKAAGKATL